MSLSNFFSLNLYNLSVLSQNRLRLLKKSRLLADFARITAKDIFFNKLARKKLAREKIAGKTIYFSDYELMRALFEEIYIEEQYFFLSDKKDPYIIDCGSNIGMAVLYFKTVYPQSKILCFEPDPVAFSFLKKNIEENNLFNVETHQNAVSGSEGALNFFVEEDKNASLSMSLFGNSLKKKNKKARKITVKSVLLSDFINERVDLLKIDVEGAEYQVFADLDQNDKLKNIDNIIIEGHVFDRSIQKNVADLLEILDKDNFTYLITNPFGMSNIAKLDNWKFMVYARKK